MTHLNRKIFRDLWRLKYQAFSIALVLACGVAAWMTFLSTEASLQQARRQFYQDSRFARIF